MRIKYISCDSETEVEEAILSAEPCETEIHGKPCKYLQCVRSPESKYYNHNPKHPGDNSFTVDFDRVEYIKA